MNGRNARQLKERWYYYLSPNINRGPWTPEEDELLLQLYRQYGSKWMKISNSFKNRTHISIRNRAQFLLKEEVHSSSQQGSENSDEISSSNVEECDIDEEALQQYDPYLLILEGLPTNEQEQKEF